MEVWRFLVIKSATLVRLLFLHVSSLCELHTPAGRNNFCGARNRKKYYSIGNLMRLSRRTFKMGRRNHGDDDDDVPLFDEFIQLATRLLERLFVRRFYKMYNTNRA